jgi:hypothetical protein
MEHYPTHTFDMKQRSMEIQTYNRDMVQHFEVEWKQINIPLHNLHLSTRIFTEINYNINTNVNNKANIQAQIHDVTGT